MTEHITSRQNPTLIHVKKLLSSRSYREKHGEYAADGTKLLTEALRWDAGVHTVICTEDARNAALPEGVRDIVVPEDVMRSISLMDAPQGAIFVCRIPTPKPLSLHGGFLILDGVQDPGNVGTIVRTADAMDIPVVLSDGCADRYNPKTVRASMGALFRSDVQCATTEEILAALQRGGIPLCVTALSDRATDIRKTPLSNAAVVIGSEGSGVSQAYLDAADHEIIIPMTERCESLNAAAAAAITLWEMKNR